ncbi:hypothetical protein D3C79_730800 [compost metagenome]
MRERGSPLRRPLRHRQVALHIGDSTLFQAQLDQVEAAGDTCQEVVEVVGNPPGQLADRFHLL